MDAPPKKARAPRNPERVGSDSSTGSPVAEDAQGGLERLRQILLLPQKQRLDFLQEHIEDPEVRCDEIAAALPEAVRRASAKDSALAASLSPLVEKGLAQSVRRNPSVIIEVIFPILGPAIRRAVASALRGAVESLNRVVEHSFTWRGLKWRIEAWRTGRTVAEVALTRSLVYRVEQVFLIHRETGLPLLTVGVDEVRQDSDLVSSMLTAIQDFVHDSFSVDGDQDLDRLEVGDFQVWIERGPRAAVAAVIRGSAPRRLRSLLAETTGDIHAEMGEPLERFDGDATPFEPARPMLENCLRQEDVRPRRRSGLQAPAVIALALAALLIAGFAWLQVRDNWRWNSYLAAVDAEPGLVAVEEGRRRALVLRDPLAADPAELLAANELSPEDVELRVHSVISTDPEIAARRAGWLLAAPDTVEAEVIDGVLRLSGAAPAEWIREALPKAAFVPGVESVESTGLNNADRMELDVAIDRIESYRILFPPNQATLGADQQASLDGLADNLQDVLRRTEALGLTANVRLLGGADPSGREQTNARLRIQRAESARRYLARQGIPVTTLDTEPTDRDLGNSAEERRSVAVEIELTAAGELP